MSLAGFMKLSFQQAKCDTVGHDVGAEAIAALFSNKDLNAKVFTVCKRCNTPLRLVKGEEADTLVIHERYSVDE